MPDPQGVRNNTHALILLEKVICEMELEEGRVCVCVCALSFIGVDPALKLISNGSRALGSATVLVANINRRGISQRNTATNPNRM